ncbi:MAG: hypothetical protein ACKVIH_04175 [Burkholderiales bacterium]
MIDQLRALRSALPGADLDAEIRRAKGVSEITQTIINSAKVEVDYLQATGQASTPFLEVPPDQPYLTNTKVASNHETQHLPGDGNGITSITRHKLRG